MCDIRVVDLPVDVLVLQAREDLRPPYIPGLRIS
jgi:hypothetical protein